jgi:hypothetical protein
VVMGDLKYLVGRGAAPGNAAAGPSPDKGRVGRKRLPASLYAARPGNARRHLHPPGQVLLALKFATFVRHTGASSSQAHSRPGVPIIPRPRCLMGCRRAIRKGTQPPGRLGCSYFPTYLLERARNHLAFRRVHDHIHGGTRNCFPFCKNAANSCSLWTIGKEKPRASGRCGAELLPEQWAPPHPGG